MVQKFMFVLVLVTSAYGCLITNCPRGGKRSGGASPFKNTIRECPSCGPDRQGQCFGPHICCGPTVGCLIGTPETHKCRRESLFSRPCIAGYAMCRGNTGRCATSGVCCTQESCYVDASCRIADAAIPNDQSIAPETNSLFSENNMILNEQPQW